MPPPEETDTEADQAAARVRASRELVDKARRIQADALKIESMCYVAMADAVSEEHVDLEGDGVGFEVVYSVTLERADAQAGDGQAMIGAILSLFSAGGTL